MIRSPDPARHARALRWAVGVGVAIMAAIALVLVFLLTLATNNRALYERNYAWLFGVNVVVALLLFAVLGWPCGWPRACAGGALAAACWSSWPPFLRWSG